jgi:hypothetical protein
MFLISGLLILLASIFFASILKLKSKISYVLVIYLFAFSPIFYSLDILVVYSH